MSRQTVGWTVAGVVGLLLVSTLFGSWFTVDQGERGVVLRNGAFIRVAEPGLGFKTPFIEDVVDLSVRTEKVVYDKLGSYSKDIQLAQLRIAVNYHLEAGRVQDVYEKYGPGYSDRILTPAVQGQSKIVFGQYTASEAISQRGKLAHDMETALQTVTKNSGIAVESVQIENIDFSKEFEHSIEERMKAEVEVSKLRQNLEREKVQADIKRTQAGGEADRIRAVAKAEADATVLKGDAEAKAIRARAEALKSNPVLIELTKAEKWDGKLPVTMLPGTTVPFVNVK